MNAKYVGGEGGIRTPVGILSQTRFPGVRLKPLIHLSERARRINQNGFCSNLKVVPPLAQGSKYAEFTSVRQAALLQGADEFRLGAAQEGISGFFQCYTGGQGGQVGGT